MDEVSNFVGDYSKRLGRPIKDLDDVRNAMSALETIRQEDIRIDMTLGPIEVGFSKASLIFVIFADLAFISRFKVSFYFHIYNIIK